MNNYADDLAAVIEALDLRDATLVGHSTGGGEVTRYIGRHGTGRVAKAALISAVPPIMLKSDANPEGLPIEVFDGMRASLAKDRSQFYKDLAVQFYGANRPDAKITQGVLDQFWLWSMQSGLKNAYDCIKAFSETDFTEDLQKFDVPTLILHGEDDQIVPVKDSARKSARLITGAQEIYYPGAPHGLTATLQDQFNADLLAFLRVRGTPAGLPGAETTVRMLASGEQCAVGVERGLAAEVGVEHRGGGVDFAAADQADQPGHRLALVDRVGDHAFGAGGEPHRIEGGVVGDAVGARMVVLVQLDLPVVQLALDADEPGGVPCDPGDLAAGFSRLG
jgi:non-heme chloroperoxidase